MPYAAKCNFKIRAVVIDIYSNKAVRAWENNLPQQNIPVHSLLLQIKLPPC